MILKNHIITDISINQLDDMHKLKPFWEDGTLKINKSQIARELKVDRRTVDKYIKGYKKSCHRHRDNCITPYYDIIDELLSDRNQQIFYYKKTLWQYLVDNYDFKSIYCNFCHCLKKYPEFNSYFNKRNHQILKKFLYDMKQMLLNRLSLIGKCQYLLSFPPAKQ